MVWETGGGACALYSLPCLPVPGFVREYGRRQGIVKHAAHFASRAPLPLPRRGCAGEMVKVPARLCADVTGCSNGDQAFVAHAWSQVHALC